MPRVLDLDLQLHDVSPRVWRRVRVLADLSLEDLHRVIQVLMNWTDYHLHVFEVGGREYGPKSEEEVEVDAGDWAGEDADIIIAEALVKGGGRIEYVYDFGDEWRLKIEVVADNIAAGPTIVECLAGEVTGPPEDCGGPHAYQEILDVWQTKAKRGLPEEIRSRLPKGFDALQFSVEGANLRLRDAFREKASPEFPAGRHAPAQQQLLANLTLAVLFLGSRETRHGTHEAWKTVRTEILETLQEAGLVYTDPRRKSVVITEEGVARATALLQRLTPLLTE